MEIWAFVRWEPKYTQGLYIWREDDDSNDIAMVIINQFQPQFRNRANICFLLWPPSLYKHLEFAKLLDLNRKYVIITNIALVLSGGNIFPGSWRSGSGGSPPFWWELPLFSLPHFSLSSPLIWNQIFCFYEPTFHGHSESAKIVRVMMMILDAVSGAARKALLGGRGHQTKLNSGSDAPHSASWASSSYFALHKDFKILPLANPPLSRKKIKQF